MFKVPWIKKKYLQIPVFVNLIGVECRFDFNSNLKRWLAKIQELRETIFSKHFDDIFQYIQPSIVLSPSIHLRLWRESPTWLPNCPNCQTVCQPAEKELFEKPTYTSQLDTRFLYEAREPLLTLVRRNFLTYWRSKSGIVSWSWTK